MAELVSLVDDEPRNLFVGGGQLRRQGNALAVLGKLSVLGLETSEAFVQLGIRRQGGSILLRQLGQRGAGIPIANY